MKLLAAAAALCTATSVANAETSLTEDNESSCSAPTVQLFEASCDVDVELRGLLAVVEVRQRIVNPGPLAVAATYEFDLPRGATITGFTLRGDGSTETAIPIAGAFRTVDAASRAMLDAETALLTALDADAGAQYRIRLQPIVANHEVWLTTRYSTLGELRGSALRVVLPGRTGKVVTSRSSAAFVLDANEVMIDGNLAFAGRDPVVRTQTQPLAAGWFASLIDAIQGGVPIKLRYPSSTTPLGDLRPGAQ